MAESAELLEQIAETMTELCEKLDIQYIFKASFDKANRSSIKTERGPGLEKGLSWLKDIAKKFKVPVTTDVHSPEQISKLADGIDLIQIPAFLARQTDFYIEAAKCKKAINVKKGQFMAPQEMAHAVTKFKESGGEFIAITERGSSFGYGNLVVDFRSLPIIQNMGVPYVFDATHSLQLPAARDGSSGGERAYLPVLLKAQIAAGCTNVFMEVHPNPAEAMSDKETQWPLSEAEALLKEVKALYDFIQNQKNKDT